MKLLFIGGCFSKKIEGEIFLNSKKPIDYAANKLQWNLIKGIFTTTNSKITIISAPFVGHYPKGYKKFYFKKYSSEETGDYKLIYVPFCNLWGYKNISRKKALIKEVKQFSFDIQDVVFLYSAHTPNLLTAKRIKKYYPRIHICLILPDLPQFMNRIQRKSMLYKIFKKIDILLFERNLAFIDSFVLCTEQMSNYLNIKDKPFVVIEGMINPEEIVIKGDKSNDYSQKKDVVYTGSLVAADGILNLLEAFHQIEDQNLNLVICGKGETENKIKEYAEIDKRIHFLGQLKNQEVLEIQRKALVLVNPRQNIGEYTKYSFPSKNMEYLLSGNPVIAYKLDGIPDEYDEYFFYPEDNSIEALRNKIIEVSKLSPEERQKIGEKCRNFVLQNKNPYVSAQKIMNMIRNERSED